MMELPLDRQMVAIEEYEGKRSQCPERKQGKQWGPPGNRNQYVRASNADEPAYCHLRRGMPVQEQPRCTD